MSNQFADNEFAYKYVCQTCKFEHDPIFSDGIPDNGLVTCGACKTAMAKMPCNVLSTEPPVTEIDRLKHQVLVFAKMAQDFCEKVEAGQIKSISTYAKFNEALALLTDEQLTDLEVRSGRKQSPEAQENERIANATRSLCGRLQASRLVPLGFDPGAIDDRVMALVYKGVISREALEVDCQVESIPSTGRTVVLSF